MSNNMLSPISSDFTAQLLPHADESCTPSKEDTLLPLIQHWVLALMLQAEKSYELLDSGRLRGLFKVGKPEYWNTRHDEPIEYADDEECSYDADMRRKIRRTGELMAQAQAQVASKASDFSHPLFANLRSMENLLGLNDTELVVLCILVLLQGDRRFNACVGNLRIKVHKEVDFVHLLSHITSCSNVDLHLALRPDGALLRMGLLTLRDKQGDMEESFDLADGLPSLLMQEHQSVEPLIRHFFTPRARSNLGTMHFPHLSDEISIVAGVLREAMRRGVAGTNVLLYGSPGVGKTELAAAVAQLLAADIFEVAYADRKGDPIRGVKRLQSYNLCQRLLSRRLDALVLFDEVEDMLEQGETPGKAWVNRTLEENPVPAIWITNNVQALDPAYRRRFDYSLHVKTPPRSVRLQIAQHHLAAIAVCGGTDSGDQAWLEDLAECPDLTPGQMQRAAKVAQLVEVGSLARGQAQPAQARVVQVLERSNKLLGHKKLRTGREMATAYDLAYLHTDVPIAQLVDSLRTAPGGSMCFYGPPGAGKTALARYIAHALELPVVVRRGSDLLSRFVGGTEHNIAEMFSAAAAESSVLILDEADSFLQSRSQAKHSWEITQVNELLTQMEEYAGLFICTTNLLEKLDAASLRRFDWKIAFSAMTASQRWAFFLQELHLLGGSIEAAKHLQPFVRQQLNGLTPGEFAPVTRQFRLLRQTPSAQEYFERLRAELITKNGGSPDSTNYQNIYPEGTSRKNMPLAA